MMKSLKFISTVLLTASVLSLSGCGKTSIAEEYSFGNATLRAGNTQLMLFTPFDLVSETIKGTDRTVYGNQDAHVSVVVTYDPATGLTLDKAVKEKFARLIIRLRLKDSRWPLSNRYSCSNMRAISGPFATRIAKMMKRLKK